MKRKIDEVWFDDMFHQGPVFLMDDGDILVPFQNPTNNYALEWRTEEEWQKILPREGMTYMAPAPPKKWWQFWK